jgi:hypothetical protein
VSTNCDGLVRRSDEPPNKGMKLTKPERIGALQLIPGVGRTVASSMRTNEGQTGMQDDASPWPDSPSSFSRG